MKGLHLVARRAILTTLKRSPVVALVHRDQIHSQTIMGDLAWPFIRLGPPQTLPLKATCVDGAVVNIPLAAFAKPVWRDMARTVMVETAEDHVCRIGAAIERVLDDRGLDLIHEGAPVRVTFRLADIALRMDGAEADAFQYACTVRCRMIAE